MNSDRYFDSLPPGWSGRETVQELYDTAMSVGEGKTILEIGSFVGRSAVNMAYATNCKTQIISVDALPDTDVTPGKVPQSIYGGEKWNILETPFEHYQRFTKGLPIKLIRQHYPVDLIIQADMIYLDANRIYNEVMGHLRYAIGNHLKPHGFFCGAHYTDGYGDQLIAAVHDFATEQRLVLQASKGSGFWTIRYP